MADTVRPRVATPRVALPKIPPQSSAQQNNAPKTASTQQIQANRSESKIFHAGGLVDHVGSQVQITNIVSQVYIGEVYSCGTELVLSTGPAEYHIIPISKITKYEILSKDEISSKRSVDDDATREKDREKDRQAKSKEVRLIKPPGVSTLGQRIFLMLDRTLPVRWHNQSIIVLDNVLIEPPYNVEDCKAPAKHGKQLERVKELVKNELEKIRKDTTLGRRGG